VVAFDKSYKPFRFCYGVIIEKSNKLTFRRKYAAVTRISQPLRAAVLDYFHTLKMRFRAPQQA
jgi:hypothetical protein